VIGGISVALLRPLAELLGRLDCDPAAFLANLGVDAEAAPGTYVDGGAVDRELAAIAARRGDPTFGLTLARTAVAWPLGVFGHVIWLSGTLRDALSRAVRFYGAVTRRTTLTLDEAGPLTTLRQHGVPGITRGAILTEYPFASLVLRAAPATAGRFAVRAVSFTHSSANPSAYREVFGVPVTFGAPADELQLDTALLDLRLASADPFTASVLETTVAQLADTRSRSPFLDRVRRAVEPHLASGEAITPEMIARELGTSVRTLRRHLEQEDSSLRAVIDELRRERAEALLAAGTPLKEIAFALGFSEPSAFSRAYKRWTGRSPT
jgi:AraC-like DNA-binding protein